MNAVVLLVITAFCFKYSAQYQPETNSELDFIGTKKDQNNTDYMNFVVNAVSDTVDVKIEYSLKESVHEGVLSELCFRVVRDKKELIEVLPSKCIDPSQREVTLKDLMIGEFIVYVTPKLKSFPDKADSEVFMYVYVEYTKPSMIIHETHVEIVADDTGFASAHIPYEVSGMSSGAHKVEACIQIENANDRSIILVPYTCILVPPSHKEFVLNRMSPGKYVIFLSLRNGGTHPEISPSPLEVSVEMRLLEEFVPSYEWQPLHAWHTIPSGIETRLPLSAAARKEARIPVPWRLQLSMPYPCKYFLRMNVAKSTTVAQIVSQASSQCRTASKQKVPSDCFKLQSDGQVLMLEDSVEGAALFSRDKVLLLSDTCRDRYA
jgi:hypothetical protein